MINYPSSLVPEGHVEPVPRRIRAQLGGRVVLDSTRALYVWESSTYPQYYIPVDDIDPAVLVYQDRAQRLRRGTATVFDFRVGGIERIAAGRAYTESDVAGLVGTARLDWESVDGWFEEDEQVFVHPRSPYVRVDALRSSRPVRIELDGVLLAEAAGSVMVFETGLPTRHYLDRTALAVEYLRPTTTETACPYKGRTSRYWTATTAGREHPDIAWSYDFPTPALAQIAGLVAFYDEKVDTYVDGQLVTRPVTHFA